MKNFYHKSFIQIALLLCLLSFNGMGQQRQFYSQYMFNGLSLNPAYAGNQKMLSATLIYKKQWVGMTGSPNTETFAVHNGNRKKKIGYGLLISRDEIGVHKDYGIYGCYAYKIRLRKGTIALGLQGGVNYLYSNYSLLNADPTPDPLLPAQTSVWNPNVGTGLFYSTKTAYIGFSIPYLINNKILDKKDISAVTHGTEERYYFLTAGKVIKLSEVTKVKPSILLRMQEEAPIGMDFNTNLMFHDIISIGASYRTGRALIFLSQIVVSDHIIVGYAYDYAFSAIQKHSRGSHEITINYRIDLNPEKCHTYF